MMGERQTDQPALFYEFSLERHVSGDHLLRSIDRFVDLGDIREQLRPFYSDTGRPSVDPELMIRMLIVGYCMGIRSERRLCEEVHLNLAYRWFCRLGLGGAVPDHSTFSKNRHGRFRESDLLRKSERVNGRPLHRERARGRRGLRGRRIDDQGRRQPPELDARRSVGATRRPWPCCPRVSGRARRSGVRRRDPRRAQVHRDRRSRLALDGREWRARFLRVSDNYLIDLDHAVIVDVEATTSVRQAEVTAARRMIERTQARFGLWPERLAADAGYGDAANLAWLVVEEKGIKPHIPVFDKSARRDGTFERADFVYDHADDSYICPGGKRLRQRRKVYREPRPFVDENGLMRYRASKLDCDACGLKHAARPTCRPARSCARSTRARAISLAIWRSPMPISRHAASGRRSRCCSPTSSAS